MTINHKNLALTALLSFCRPVLHSRPRSLFTGVYVRSGSGESYLRGFRKMNLLQPKLRRNLRGGLVPGGSSRKFFVCGESFGVPRTSGAPGAPLIRRSPFIQETGEDGEYLPGEPSLSAFPKDWLRSRKAGCIVSGGYSSDTARESGLSAVYYCPEQDWTESRSWSEISPERCGFYGG